MQLKFDYVYMTGDIPAHNVWNIDKEMAVSANCVNYNEQKVPLW